MVRRTQALLRALRPEQWLKNGFVLAPLIFAGMLTDLAQWLRAGTAFLCFCAAASATYLLNDVLDREADRSHPIKCRRAIAAGDLSVRLALVLALILVTLGGFGALFVDVWFMAVLLGYLALTVLYSSLLKEAVFIDVLVVAAGFVFRVVGGAVAIDVPVSRWLLLCAYLLALYLALGKRRAELVLLGAEADTHRTVRGHDTLHLVDQAISVVLGATVLAYTLYTVAPDTVRKVGSEGLMITVPVVLYGLFRYLYLLHRHELGGSPTKTLLADRPLLACVAVWLVMAAVVIGVG